MLEGVSARTWLLNPAKQGVMQCLQSQTRVAIWIRVRRSCHANTGTRPPETHNFERSARLDRGIQIARRRVFKAHEGRTLCLDLVFGMRAAQDRGQTRKLSVKVVL